MPIQQPFICAQRVRSTHPFEDNKLYYRDALRQSKSCELLHNCRSKSTANTVMETEHYGRPRHCGGAHNNANRLN